MNFSIKNVFLVGLLIILSACNQEEKKAEKQLNLATTYFSQNNLNQAKLEVDKIRKEYPKQFRIILQGKQLLRKIELKEQEKTLRYCDSTLQVLLPEITALKKEFIAQKDEDNKLTGTYIYPTQTTKKNPFRTYLRTTVNEKGEVTLVSIYRGKSPVEHQAITLSNNTTQSITSKSMTEDGANNYRFKVNGDYNEFLTIRGKESIELVKYINLNLKKRVKVTLLGKRNYRYYMTSNDKKAIYKIYQLASFLSDYTHMQHEQLLAKAKVAYLKKKIEAVKEKTAKEEK